MSSKVLCPILSKEIDKLPSTLSIEDEVNLLTLAKKGNTTARNKLIETQMRQIVSWCRSYANNQNSINELISDAVIGFDKAIHKYDFNANVRFITYYMQWVRDSLNRSIHSNHTIRPPMNIAKTNSKTDDELDKMENNKRKKDDYVHIGFSINTPVSDDGNTTFEDTLRSTASTDKAVNDRLMIAKILKIVPKNTREWQILKYHHIDGMDLTEIGNIFGCSKQHISAIMIRTIKRIKGKIELKEKL